MKKCLYIIIPVLICFLVGYISGLFQATSLAEWYPYLEKSKLTPPNIVFPIAWSILYLLMGISVGLVLLSRSPRKSYIVRLFAVQLFFNFMWSISFFFLQNPYLGLINILLLDIAVVSYAVRVFHESKAASILFYPYIVWVLFATYLNLYIALFN